MAGRPGCEAIHLRTTRSHEMCLRPNGESQKVIGPAMKDFVRVNQQSWLLERRFSISEPYQLVAEGGKFPRSPEARAWFALGAVGFYWDRTIAVAYIEYRRDCMVEESFSSFKKYKENGCR